MVINDSNFPFYDQPNIFTACTVTVRIVLCFCFYAVLRLLRIEKKKWSHKLIDPLIFIIKARVSSNEKCVYLFHKLFTVYLRRAFMILSLFAVSIFYRTNIERIHLDIDILLFTFYAKRYWSPYFHDRPVKTFADSLMLTNVNNQVMLNLPISLYTKIFSFVLDMRLFPSLSLIGFIKIN